MQHNIYLKIEAMLQISFWGIYCQGSRKKFTGNIRDYQKFSKNIGKNKLGPD
jgi:hypothetical protein